MSHYELIGTLFGIAGVWLTTRENAWCWPVGIVNVGLYAIVFYQAKLYADSGLQIVYVALCAYGWYRWRHPGPNRRRLPVTRVGRLEGALLLGIGVVASILLGRFLAQRTDASLPVLDSATTVASLCAQWLQTRKILESWHVWIVTDLVYIGLYVYKHLLPTAALYAVFTALAVVGLRAWRRSLAS